METFGVRLALLFVSMPHYEEKWSGRLENWIERTVWFFYGKVYARALSKLLPRQELFTEALNKLKICRNCKYLDAGCGSGDFSFLIYSEGGRVVGLDNSQDVLKRAREKYSMIDFVYGDLEKELPFLKNEEFDGVVSINSIYLIKNFKEIDSYKIPFPLVEFKRLLKKGGILLIVTPKYPGYSQKIIFEDHLKKSFAKRGKFRTFLELIVYFPWAIIVILANLYIQKKGKIGYYNFYKEIELENSLKACGFRDIELTLCYSGQNIMAVARK